LTPLWSAAHYGLDVLPPCEMCGLPSLCVIIDPQELEPIYVMGEQWGIWIPEPHFYCLAHTRLPMQIPRPDNPSPRDPPTRYEKEVAALIAEYQSLCGWHI
jgi:hypothetical protein